MGLSNGAGLCSLAAADNGETLPGTAPQTRGWLVIEQPGPYGRDALRESYLPPDLAMFLGEDLAGAGVKVVLVRRNVRPGYRGPRAETPTPVETLDRRVWWCSGDGRDGLWSLQFLDPERLRALDLTALVAGRVDEVHPAALPVSGPLLLVCTNGARDKCCAIRGRPVVTSLFADPDLADAVWECSHLGGHRFAATAIELPHGWSHGRLDAEAAARVLTYARSGRVSLQTARGRSALAPAAQAAELAVRRARAVDTIAGLDVGPDPAHDGIWLVTLGTGHRVRVRVTSVPLPERAESCGADPTAAFNLEAQVLD